MIKKLLASLLLAAGLLAPLGASANTTVGPFSMTKTSFDFYYSIGGGLPTEQLIEMTNNTNSIIYIQQSIPNQPYWLTGGYNTDPLPTDPGSPMGIGAGVDAKGLPVGDYKTTLYINGNFPSAPIAIPINLHILAAGTAQPANTVHPEGTNIKTSDGTVYRINFGSRTPYTSSGAFLSYGYNNWADVVDANSADLALPTGTCTPYQGAEPRPCYIQPRDGSLINDHGTVYIISDGYRAGFASASVFLGLGYSFKDALPGDTSFLQTAAPINSSQISHPSGTVVNANGTICVVESPFKTGGQIGRKCYATLADMNSWGIRDYEILWANSYDMQLPILGTIAARSTYSDMNP